MQPCGGDGEAVGAMLQPQVVQPAQAVSKAPSAQGGLMLFYELGPAGDAEGDSEGGAGATGADGACSPAGGLDDLDDEDESGAQSGGGGGGGCKNCTYEGCNETTTQVAKQRKPWMCKRHRNKMYKDKYKRKKSDQALGSGGGTGGAGGGGNAPCSATAVVAAAAAAAGAALSGSGGRIEQRTGNIGDRPAKPTLLEQVLNQKRLSLLRSPEVVQFLQKRQQLLSQQALEQRQQFSGAPM
ncbi:PREDICTED: regulatory factor X-associated protein [Thamnophis sirtalis]|uniref:Regulatory factor X-associated protein n=1 Tax=Thamnophis sirtalis TaxID=35019 RepID=A0A6I9Y3P8_9SAUR|nr:PREDICTED: regulatory factor X-associated protein [Thamnophis sirtalis]